ncbi:flagellar protein FliT [Stutzerimonas tarimensis]|uniref:Flagellar protein FliT n=1 Tax=Stutzerimonas tarimensis TaxID=1507735 RepID=A0ABV7T9M6_9GAMM
MNTTVQQLVETGSALRDALQRQDWTAIGALDLHCRRAVEDAMREPLRDEESMRQSLEELLSLYNEMVAQCQAEQQRVAAELLHLNQSRQGAKVYQLFG